MSHVRDVARSVPLARGASSWSAKAVLMCASTLSVRRRPRRDQRSCTCTAGASASLVPVDFVPALQAQSLALDCIIVTVDYRLAPETPFSGRARRTTMPLLSGSAQMPPILGIDPMRIAIQGESAGGGHAAMLAIAARDRSGSADSCSSVSPIRCSTTGPAARRPCARAHRDLLLDRQSTTAWAGPPFSVSRRAAVRCLPAPCRRELKISRACPPHSSGWERSTSSWTRTLTSRGV